MIQELHFPQASCPIAIQEQITRLLRQEWPEVGEIAEQDDSAVHPTTFVLTEGDTIISHLEVVWKDITHHGQTYRAFGLSAVVTHSAYRKRGLGLRLVKAATSFIEQNNPDIGIFTCLPHLVPFYTQGGWHPMEHTNVIGGTREKPFRSDSLGLATMMRFFSQKAQLNRSAFEGADVYLELGEKMLW